MSHDCVPNTSHNDEEINYVLTVRASTNIPQNYPITLSYAYTLQVSILIYTKLKTNLLILIVIVQIWKAYKVYLINKGGQFSQ